LIAFSIGTGAMVFLSMLNLASDSGFSTIAKSGMLAAFATLVSYGVNRFAIEKGARLAATGFVIAGIVSVFSMLAVGGGLFSSIYSGLVIKEVRELELQRYGQSLVRFVGERNQIAVKASRIIPVIRTNETDLEQHVECEARESCLSGRKNGGRGLVTRTLEKMARRASTIARQMEAGKKRLGGILSKLNRLTGKYQQTLGQSDEPLKQRRQKLILIDAKIGQEISKLDEALPVSLLRAYEKELITGISIPAREVATKRINALLSRHAASLGSVLSTLKTKGQSRPEFPARAGVSKTLDYIGHFLPVAILTASIELIFPLSLWIYTLLAIVWDKHLLDPPTPPRDHKKRGRPSSRRTHRRARGQEYDPDDRSGDET
jgi:hypothetical protein